MAILLNLFLDSPVSLLMQGDGRAIEELFLARPATPNVQATNDGHYNFYTGNVKSFPAVFMALYVHGGEGTTPSRRKNVVFRVNFW